MDKEQQTPKLTIETEVKQPTQNKNGQKKQQDKQQEDIDKLLNQFQGGDLNLTGQQAKQDQKEDEEVMKKIKEQYENFMKQMNQQMNTQGGDDAGMGGLGKAFQQLLSGLNDGDETGKHIGQKFEHMFKNLEDPGSFENAASELLNQFMDKSLLQQPLQETKVNYQKYFAEKGGKDKVPQQHRKQAEVVDQLLQVLKQTPEQKKKLIQLFTKLQEYGQPPTGIAPGFSLF